MRLNNPFKTVNKSTMLFFRKKQNNKKTGDLGEDIACKELCKQGYKIIERNFRTRRGEIDIIARENGQLVFVEVKARRSRQFGNPEEAVNKAKALKIAKCAQEYMTAMRITQETVRCDIVSVILGNNDNENTIEVFRDALDMGDFLL